jgi:XTP/dITP diphosphohydrolase
MRIVVATGNAGKLAELRDLLGDADLELIAQAELGIADAEETGSTFIENALIKARHAAHLSGLPAIADDSGLLVDALDGAPGLHTARYAGPGATAGDNIARLLAALAGMPDENRGAAFHACIVLLRDTDDPRPLIGEGQWHGRILQAPRGNGGFGYDPVFFDPERRQSAAEMDPALKNRISHRGRAVAALREQWRAARR